MFFNHVRPPGTSTTRITLRIRSFVPTSTNKGPCMTDQTDPKKYRSTLQALLGCRPVAYYPILARALGGVNAALFLSQLLYWQSTKPDQTFYKLSAELVQETGLSTCEQSTARSRLIKLGVITATRKGWCATWHYQVDMDRICDLLNDARIRTSPESDDAGIRQGRNPATPESDKAGIRRGKNPTKTESDDAGIRRPRNPAKVKSGSAPSAIPTEGAIDELNTENTTESKSKEEEGEPRQNFLVLDADLATALLAYGVFKSKLIEVDQSGFTAPQIRQMMADCKRDDKRGTPAALLLKRLQEIEPTKTGYGYPQYNLPPRPDEPTGPSIYDLVWDAIERALRPLIGVTEAATVADKIELVGMEGADPDNPTTAVISCTPIIWSKFIEPNSESILAQIKPLGFQDITYEAGG